MIILTYTMITVLISMSLASGVLSGVALYKLQKGELTC